MKDKRSIKKIIMRRFIGYSIGIALVLLILEILTGLISWGTGWNFADLAFSPLREETQTLQIAMSVFWNLIVVLVYILGVKLFGRGISRKIVEPVQRMVEGFREVTDGNLNTSLEFETETEFKEMRDAFNYMVKRLKDSEEKRMTMENELMQLYSNIAHDLKTPMTTITGYAGALADSLVEEPEKQQEYYMAIRTKTKQVNQLIDQLLSYSKLGTPQYHMNFQSTDLVELVRVACAALFGEMESKQMELELELPDDPVYCKVDSLEINRAVNNLLTNAIHHNPAGSLLLVQLNHEADRVVIQIADNGADIPEAIVSNLFEPFVSGDYSRSAGSGTGLGLAIVKKVMEGHDGDVFVTTAPEPYTKMFVLRLGFKIS